MGTTERPLLAQSAADAAPSPGSAEAREGLALAVAAETEVAQQLQALLAEHRGALEQLGGPELAQLEREVATALQQRAAMQKAFVHKPRAASRDERHPPGVFVALPLVVGLSSLWASRGMMSIPVPQLAALDLVLLVAAFFAATAHYSVVPSPPVAPPPRPSPALPPEFSPQTSRSWRSRLEDAQAWQRRLSTPAPLEAITASHLKALTAYRSALGAWLATAGQDYLGWMHRPWPTAVRTVGWLFVVAASVIIGVAALTLNERTTVHLVGALTTGAMTGFLRRGMLPPVSPH